MPSPFEFLGRFAAECDMAGARYPRERAMFSRFAAECREAQLRCLETSASSPVSKREHEDADQAHHLATDRPAQHNPLRWLSHKLLYKPHP